MSGKIYFYKHFEEPHYFTTQTYRPSNHTPVNCQTWGCLSLVQHLHGNNDTRVLSHLFKMKKTDNTKCCWGDTEHVSQTPLISVETCTPSFTVVRWHLPKVNVPPTDRAFLLQGIGSCTTGRALAAEWTSVSWYNSCNGTMHGTETDAPAHMTWITSTNRCRGKATRARLRVQNQANSSGVTESG